MEQREIGWKAIALERKAELEERFKERHETRMRDADAIDGAFGKDSQTAKLYRAGMEDMRAPDVELLKWMNDYVESFG